jgi:hypothetical protein
MKTIWYLVKFCEKEEWADDFLKGSLYLNRLSYFKQKEAEDDDRFDKHEAVASWLQPSGITIKFLNHPELDIHPEDLGAPVSISFDHHNHLHVLCLYAIHTGRFDCVDGLIDYAEEDANELKEQLMVHENCFKFGGHAVIVRAADFISRVKKAVENLGHSGIMKLVDYYDPNLFNGNFLQHEIPFKKQQKHSYQNEFRIVVNNGRVGDDPLRIEVGDLSDISAKIEATSLNGLLKIESIKV